MKTPRIFALLASGILATSMVTLGCADNSPRAITQPPRLLVFTIAGTVFEHTGGGRRPVAGVELLVRSAETVVTTSDAQGRYSASVHGDVVSIAPVESEPYTAPCPSGTTWLSNNPDQTFDVHIVSKVVLSRTGVPDSYPITSIYVSGTIVEPTPDGFSPVAGATVSLGERPTLSFSTTLSDSLGRYVLCTAPPGVGTDQMMPLNVAKDGYVSTRRLVLGGWDERNVDVALTQIW